MTKLLFALFVLAALISTTLIVFPREGKEQKAGTSGRPGQQLTQTCQVPAQGATACQSPSPFSGTPPGLFPGRPAPGYFYLLRNTSHPATA